MSFPLCFAPLPPSSFLLNPSIPLVERNDDDDLSRPLYYAYTSRSLPCAAQTEEELAAWIRGRWAVGRRSGEEEEEIGQGGKTFTKRYRNAFPAIYICFVRK